MPRKNLIRTDEFPYHVTIRSNNKEWFDLPLQVVWEICLNAISKANFKFPVSIEGFVLMSNHYHLLIYTPGVNLDKFMNVLNSCISREIRYRTKRINRIFGDRYKWKIINSQLYYNSVIRYVFQNPLRANLCLNCEDYPYSSLHCQYYNKRFPVELPIHFTSNEMLNYFNEFVKSYEVEDIKQNLSSYGSSHL